MADQLYLSLWYPNFRMSSLGPALLGVMRQFAVIGGPPPRVRAATVYPISWNEAPVYQRLYDPTPGGPELVTPDPENQESAPEYAVPAALEALYDDFAYEFEIAWDLWMPALAAPPDAAGPSAGLWQEQPSTVRITGFGPEFDDGAYDQNGQIRVDFGLDTPFLQEEVALDPDAAAHIRDNVQKLVEFTNAVQKNCGISTRLLWSESGESLAQKLVARLQQVN